MRHRWFTVFIVPLISTLCGMLTGFIGSLYAGMLIENLPEETVNNLYPVVEGVFFIVIAIIFIIGVISALRLGTSQWPPKDTGDPEETRLPSWMKFLGIRHFLSQLRYSVISSLLIILIIVYLGVTTKFNLLHWLLVFFIIIDVVLQFYVASGLVRNTLSKTILQFLTTLGKQHELALEEALGHRESKLRISVYLYNIYNEDFRIKFSYQMLDSLDRDMPIELNQGVVGRVFNSGRPELINPYSVNDMGFNADQISKVPTNLKWRYGFPLRANDLPFGVMTVDCDHAVSQDWLNKFLDFTHATATYLGIILSEFPSQEIQEAFRH